MTEKKSLFQSLLAQVVNEYYIISIKLLTLLSIRQIKATISFPRQSLHCPCLVPPHCWRAQKVPTKKRNIFASYIVLSESVSFLASWRGCYPSTHVQPTSETCPFCSPRQRRAANLSTKLRAVQLPASTHSWLLGGNQLSKMTIIYHLVHIFGKELRKTSSSVFWWRNRMMSKTSEAARHPAQQQGLGTAAANLQLEKSLLWRQSWEESLHNATSPKGRRERSYQENICFAVFKSGHNVRQLRYHSTSTQQEKEWMNRKSSP